MKYPLIALNLALAAAIGIGSCTSTTPACAADGRAKRTPKHHYTLGYVPDKHFPKGVLTFENSPFRSVAVQQSADLTALMTPDDNQGQVGECTGHGLARCRSASLKKLNPSAPFVLFSPKFIYYNERVLMGTVNQDSGAMIGEDGIATLQKEGACLLQHWDMNQDWRQKPADCAYADGLNHLVTHAYKVDNRHGQDLEKALSAGFVVVFGVTLHEEFEDLTASNYTYRGKGSVIGGHCMVFFKYDLKTGMIWGHNQWGDSWGLNDTFAMPLSIAHSAAVDDCYVMDILKDTTATKASSKTR